MQGTPFASGLSVLALSPFYHNFRLWTAKVPGVPQKKSLVARARKKEVDRLEGSNLILEHEHEHGRTHEEGV